MQSAEEKLMKKKDTIQVGGGRKRGGELTREPSLEGAKYRMIGNFPDMC
jgi:hypothetical protein